MQRVTNCIIHRNGEVLLMKKPRRGWWYAPGGKVDALETIQETVIREVQEETGLNIKQPELKSVITIVIQDQEVVVNEWMLFTFFADQFQGQLQEENAEGELAWWPIEEALQLPMPDGDCLVLAGIMDQQPVLIGRFVYTPDYELISYVLHNRENLQNIL